jgi:hypothetical protein
VAEQTTTTPAGIEIRFEDGLPGPDGKSKRRCYWVNGQKLPSVTTVLNVLDKPGLKFWGEKIGVAGAIALAKEGKLPLNVPAALSAMQARDLRIFQSSDKAASRGTLAHEDLLAVVTGEKPADLDAVPRDQRGFLRGVAAFASQHRPEAIDTETMVASLVHGFSGRYDVRARLRGIDGVGLLDLKTTEELPRYKNLAVRPPYDENLLQVEGYDIASVESGYGKSDYRAIVRVDSKGEWDLTISWAEHDDFLAALRLYQRLRELSDRAPELWRGTSAVAA